MASLTQQSKQDAAVKYAPAKRALKQALQDAAAKLSSGVKAERGVAQGIRQTAHAQLPALGDVYGAAGQSVAGAHAMIAPDLAAFAGGTAAPIAASAARDAQGTQLRLATALAAARASVGAREQDALAGEQYGVGRLQDTAHTDAAKILAQILGVAQDQGTFQAADLSKLQTAKSKTDAAAATRDAKVNAYGYTAGEWQGMTTGQRQAAMLKFTSEKHAASTGGKGGVKLLAPGEQQSAQKQIEGAHRDGLAMLGHGIDPLAAQHALSLGRQRSSVFPTQAPYKGKTFGVDPRDGTLRNPDGSSVKDPDNKPVKVPKTDRPAIKGYGDLYARAGLELAQGGLSKATRDALRAEGVDLSQIQDPRAPAGVRRKKQG